MTFAQALARIEVLQQRANKPRHAFPFAEVEEIQALLLQHADSIVQLAKVAQGIRNSVKLDTDSYGLHIATLEGEDLIKSCQTYDKLMKGEPQ